MSTIRIQRGQSVSWRLTVRQNDLPLDLTGCQWEVLEPTSKPIATIEVVEGLIGVSRLLIDKDQTKLLPKRDFTLRCRLIFPDGSAIAPPPITVQVS